MKIRHYSDLHLEMFKTHAKKALNDINPKDIDILIISGDFIRLKSRHYDTIDSFEAFEIICKKFPKVIFVAGNHEFYRTSIKEGRQLLKDYATKIDNLTVLDNDIANISGVRFIGGTMWFPKWKCHKWIKRQLNDFRLIKNSHDIYMENLAFTRWIHDMIPNKQPTIIITHHAPSIQSINIDRYRDANFNTFYYSSMEKEIRRLKPLIWFSGHTHWCMNYMIDSTRIIANCHGYYNGDVDNNFDWNHCIDLNMIGVDNV